MCVCVCVCACSIYNDNDVLFIGFLYNPLYVEGHNSTSYLNTKVNITFNMFHEFDRYKHNKFKNSMIFRVKSKVYVSYPKLMYLFLVQS